MGCLNVPPYLHYTEKKKIYPSRRFLFWHLLYRTGYQGNSNPLETSSMRAGYSVCWSKLIKHNDVLPTVLSANPNLGDTVYFGKIHQFKKIKIRQICNEGAYQGEHVVKFLIKHRPETCNYSHSELWLIHTYYENDVKKEVIVKYDNWASSLFEKGKPPKFFKDLRNAYRAKAFTILNNKLNHNNLPKYLKFHPKVFLVKCAIYLNLR